MELRSPWRTLAHVMSMPDASAVSKHLQFPRLPARKRFRFLAVGHCHSARSVNAFDLPRVPREPRAKTVQIARGERLSGRRSKVPQIPLRISQELAGEADVIGVGPRDRRDRRFIERVDPRAREREQQW